MIRCKDLRQIDRRAESQASAILLQPASDTGVALPGGATHGFAAEEGWYRQFLHHGKRHTFAIGPVDETEATSKAAQIDYLLLRLKQRLIELPPGIDIIKFHRHDSKPAEPAPAEKEANAPAVAKGIATLAAFRDCYLATHRDSLEPRTVGGIELHFKHLCRILGDAFPIREY